MSEEKAPNKSEGPPVSSEKKGMSTKAKVGLGIGIGCCLIFLLILGLILGGIWKIGGLVKEEKNYAAEFKAIGESINKTLDEFQGSMDAALKKSPNFDASDMAAAEKAYKALDKDYSHLLAMEVPQNYKNVHQLFEKGIKYYLDGIMMYKNGLKTKDPQDFQSSSDLFKKGQKELEKADAELDKMSQ